jgi:hypothetical protein
MPVEAVFAVKLIVSFLLCGVIAGVLHWRARLEPLLVPHQNWVLAGLVVAMRVVPFVAVFLVLNETPRGDIGFFYGKATLAARGKLVYRDFWSFHSPVFSYILAIPLFFWHSPKALVLLMGIGDVVCLWLTHRFYAARQPDAFWRSVVYLLLPGPLIICLLGGQEDIWLWGFGLWAMLIWQRSGQGFVVGLVMALGLLTLKITFVLIVLPMVILMQPFGQKQAFLGTLLLVGIPALLLLYSQLGWLFLMPVQHADLPFSPNLVSVLRPLADDFLGNTPIKTLNLAGMVLTLSLAGWAGYRFRHKPLARAFPALWIITFGGLMLFQTSAMAYYLYVYMLAIVFELTDFTKLRSVALLLFINLLVVSQPYIYIKLNQPKFTSLAMLGNPALLLEYALEVLFVGCVIAYIRLAWLRLQRLQATDSELSL